MNERSGGLGAGAQIGLLLVVALVVVLGFALWLMGGAFVRTLGLILVGALALAVVLAASALPIRALKKRDLTGESHYYHDGTKTIERERILDGRPVEAPKLYQLPPQPAGMVFPELMRAAFQAGALAPRGTAARYAGAVDAEVNDLGPASDGWNGDIK